MAFEGGMSNSRPLGKITKVCRLPKKAVGTHDRFVKFSEVVWIDVRAESPRPEVNDSIGRHDSERGSY